MLLDLNDLVLQLFGLLENIVFLGFHWSGVFINTLILQLSEDSVQLIDFELSLVNSVVSLLNILLKFLNLIFFLFELGDKFFKLLLEKVILLNTVEVIDPNSRNLIRQILDFNLLLGNILVSYLGLLKKVSR